MKTYSIKSFFLVFGLVLFSSALQAQDTNFEKLKAKSDAYKDQTLVFKGFYLGMPVEDAQSIINFQLGLQQSSATPLVNTNDAAAENNPGAQALLGAFGQLAEMAKTASGSDNSTSYNIYKKGNNLIVAQDDTQLPFAIAGSDGKIVMFDLSPSVINRLFDAASTPSNEFLKGFMNAYRIPVMEPMSQKLVVSLMGMQQVVGVQSLLQYRSPKGFELTYHQDVLWDDQSAKSLVKYYPEGHITLKLIKTAQEREAKFN
jgi:hypothetical protein